MHKDGGGDLFRLVYASRAIVPVLPRFEATVAEILVVSQANNARLEVTGLLLAHQGWFVQTLEGPRRNVSAVFSAIGRDLRHAQLELLAGGAASTRLFGRWSMCARSIDPGFAPVLETLDLAPDFDPFQLEGAKALALLTAIARFDPAPARRAV
jgi:hypothetical protein